MGRAQDGSVACQDAVCLAKEMKYILSFRPIRRYRHIRMCPTLRSNYLLAPNSPKKLKNVIRIAIP